MALRAGVLTVSDAGARGERDDTAGPAVAAALAVAGFAVAARALLPDEEDEIAALLRRWCDDEDVALVGTTGGTGLAPRDRTPQATAGVIDYEVPGLAEAMRAAGRNSTPFASLSRGLAGVRGRTLLLNLPGSERGATESIAAVLGVLRHACTQLSLPRSGGPSGADPDTTHAELAAGSAE